MRMQAAYTTIYFSAIECKLRLRGKVLNMHVPPGRGNARLWRYWMEMTSSCNLLLNAWILFLVYAPLHVNHRTHHMVRFHRYKVSSIRIINICKYGY